MDWSQLDTWIVITAALAAIGCALPGTFLLLRRQSLMGDALSHSVLPGIVLAYLLLTLFESRGWISNVTSHEWRQPILFLGAAVTAILSGSLSALLTRIGRLDPGAALGVVYTSMFALGLFLIRLAADDAHIDQGCVLYGNLETIVTNTISGTSIPRAAVVNATIVVINLLMLCLFYKELQLCTFDAGLAKSLGLPVTLVEQALLVCTGATVVAAFESVGSILVIAMLVVPSACGVLLSQRLPMVLIWSAVVGTTAAVLGHVAALTVPAGVRWLLAWPDLGEASTSGMMAVVSGMLFFGCWLFAPRVGVLSTWLDRRQLQQRILIEDILGAMYRLDEIFPDSQQAPKVAELATLLGRSPDQVQNGARALAQSGDLDARDGGYVLTPAGKNRGQSLVRSHRLWESYLARHFQFESPRLHESAERVEHFLGPQLREELAEELEQPGRDPHGSTIPSQPEEPTTP